MTEYGEKLVEAGVGGYEQVFDVTTIWRPEHRTRAMRLALLAFLDKLVSEGPSEGMHAASFRELRCHVHDLDWAEDTFGNAFTAMLRALRTEIAEER